MKTFIVFAAIALSALPVHARGRSSYGSTVQVRTYIRPSTGTVVNSYVRTKPDHTMYNNWSSKPNINPYTGRRGTVIPTR